MPTIWNANSLNSIENKKLTSKLTFSTGEKFLGKIIKKDGSNVTIKLADGWQFKAEINEDTDFETEGKLKFIVEDIKDGKLKLKVVQENNLNKEEIIKDKLLLKFIKSERLSKEDISILKEMLKREIPLTKENINKFKELINFFDSIKENDDEGNKFISNYLKSKGIEHESNGGEEIRNILKEFIGSIKTLSKKEFIFLLENNIELNTKSIKGFNKLFKEENGFKDFLINVEKEILNIKNNRTENSIEEKDIIKNEKLIGTFKENIDGINDMKKMIINNNYNGTEEKISVVDILKSMTNPKDEGISSVITNMIVQENLLNSEEFNEVLRVLKGLTEEKLAAFLRDNISTEMENSTVNLEDEDYKIKAKDIKEKAFTEKNISNVISKLINKEIKISQGDCEKIAKILDNINEEVFLEKEKLDFEIIKKETFNPINKEIQENIKEKLNNFKILNDILKSEDLIGKGNDKLVSFIKNNINEFKLLNSLSNEYYYMDIPVKVRKEDYPCKLIIKDNRKDDKKVDKNNIKVVVSIKTINLGTIDSYLHFTNNNLKITFKCKEESIKALKIGVNRLKESLKELKLNLKIEIMKKEEEITIANCRNFFAKKENRMIDTMV